MHAAVRTQVLPPTSEVLAAKATKASSPHPHVQVNSAVIPSAAVGIPTMSEEVTPGTFHLTREETDSVVGLLWKLSEMKIHKALTLPGAPLPQSATSQGSEEEFNGFAMQQLCASTQLREGTNGVR